MHNYLPLLASAETVPFRFTPNMQHFVGPICTEGVLTSSMMSMARSLTEPEVSFLNFTWDIDFGLKTLHQFDLDQQLCLFARDEVANWFSIRGKTPPYDQSFRKHVAACVDNIVTRAELVACKIEREQVCKTS